MSKIRKTFCTLVAALVLVTMTGTGVFAEGETPEQAPGTDNVTVTDEVTVDGAEADAMAGEGENTVDEVTEGEGDVPPTDSSEEPPVAEPIVIDLADTAVVTINPIKNKTWTGKSIKPSVKVTAMVTKTDPETGTETQEPVELVKGTDFTVSYANNKAVGKATATIKGTANTDPAVSPYSCINSQSVKFKIVKPTIKPVKNVKALAGYNAIKLTWKASPDADYYYIERRVGKKVVWNRVTDKKETKSCSWENSKNINKNKTYNYRVYAIKDSGDKKHDGSISLKKRKGKDFMSKAAVSNKVKTARSMYIKVTMKQTVGALKSGKTYKATGYGSGQYKIKKNGRTYSIARIRVKNQKAYYQKNGEYSYAAVNFFMNGGTSWAKGKEFSFLKSRGFSTSRTYFVWVNTYNQHVYIMKKDGSKWKTVDDWKCSMGTAKTPSPTGQRTIIKFRAHHPGHGAPNWNFITWSNYLQHGTALHGLESGWAPKLGTLASHGCIRNPTEKAGELHSRYSGNGMKVIIW